MTRTSFRHHSINADGTTGPDAGAGPDARVLPAAARLAQIPGVSEDLARAVIAETGLDMTRFPTCCRTFKMSTAASLTMSV